MNEGTVGFLRIHRLEINLWSEYPQISYLKFKQQDFGQTNLELSKKRIKSGLTACTILKNLKNVYEDKIGLIGWRLMMYF